MPCWHNVFSGRNNMYKRQCVDTQKTPPTSMGTCSNPDICTLRHWAAVVGKFHLASNHTSWLKAFFVNFVNLVHLDTCKLEYTRMPLLPYCTLTLMLHMHTHMQANAHTLKTQQHLHAFTPSHSHIHPPLLRTPVRHPAV
jgi:hypothetical protein